MSEAAKAHPLILEQLEHAERSAGRSFRLRFLAVWVAILVGLATLLVVTGVFRADFVAKWAPFIIGGVGITVLVCVASIALATFMAVLGALGRLSPNPILFGIASFYVSFVRGTPLLVQIFFLYYALPRLGIIIDAIPTGIMALGFNYGAYMTEIFRAGIQAVPRGQRQAAEALGMRESIVMRRIVLPQATRIVIPAIGNEFIAMIKDSALVSTISVQEVLWRAGTAGRSNQATLEAFLVAALVYWALTIAFSLVQSRLERRMARSDR